MTKKNLYCQNCYHYEDPVNIHPCNACDDGCNFDRDPAKNELQNHLYGNWEPENKIDIPSISIETLKDNLEWSMPFSVIGVPAKHYRNLLEIIISYLE
jgi:hypothetical protein